jgi:hypothetical protein
MNFLVEHSRVIGILWGILVLILSAVKMFYEGDSDLGLLYFAVGYLLVVKRDD